MRRITIRHRVLGRDDQGVTGFSRVSIFDLRLLGAIALALIIPSLLLSPEPVRKNVRTQIARGEHGVQITSFAFSPTGEQFATTNSAGRVTLRAYECGWRIERRLDFPGHAKSVAFSPDGRFVAAAGYGPHVCLWDITSAGSEAARTLPASSGHATRVLFSTDGESLAVATAHEGTVRLWNLATRRERMVLRHSSPILNIAFSPDGRRMATGGRDDSSILLWDLETGGRRALLEDEPGYQHTIRLASALAFSPDGALLASASFHENSVRLWDLNRRREFRVIAEHTRSVNSIAFSADGKLLASASNDGTIGLWTVATGQRRVTVDAQATSLRTVAFSPDGRTLALAAMDDDDVRMWDVAELLLGPA
jgi:WD40 repeat protein